MATNPRSCRARITASKPVASAQAPCTRTIVGLISSGIRDTSLVWPRRCPRWSAGTASLMPRVCPARRRQARRVSARALPAGAGGRQDDARRVQALILTVEFPADRPVLEESSWCWPGFVPHLTFANVVSLMALFVALSGGAYALSIPKNSVGAKQLTERCHRPEDQEGCGDLVEGEGSRAAGKGLQDGPASRRPTGGNRGRRERRGAPGISGLQRGLQVQRRRQQHPQDRERGPARRASASIGAGATHSNAGAGEIVIDQIQPSDENTVPGTVAASAHATGTVPSWSVTAFALCADVP